MSNPEIINLRNMIKERKLTTARISFRLSEQKRYSKKNTEERQKFINCLKDMRGGKCELCGYNKNYACLDFHHLTNKKFGINQTHNVVALLEEANKCQLLCKNCHNNLHHPQHRK